MDKGVVDTTCDVFASAEYLSFSPANFIVRSSTSLRAISIGEKSCTEIPVTSDRLSTVGKMSSVVSVVFSAQISSVPSGVALA